MEPAPAGDAVVLMVESQGMDVASVRRAVAKRLGRPMLSLLDEGASSASLFVSVLVRGRQVAIVLRPLHGGGPQQRTETRIPAGGQRGLVDAIAQQIEAAVPVRSPAVRTGGAAGGVVANAGSARASQPVAAGRSTAPRGRGSSAASWPPSGAVVEVIDPFRSGGTDSQTSSRLRIDSGVLDPWASVRIAYLTETIDPWGGRHWVAPLATSEVIDPFSPHARFNVGLLDPWAPGESREPGTRLTRPRSAPR